MDHITIKTIHILTAGVVFVFFLLRAYPVLIDGVWNNTSTWKNKALVACQHSGYTALVATGIWLLWHKHFMVQPWFYGKIALFILILVASSIGFKRRVNWSIPTRKKALITALFAFIAIVCLIATKPHFG